jgi:hypothetical protein
VLLAAGALAGAMGAATEIAGRRVAMPSSAVAVVAGVPIAEAEYARALDAVVADRRGGTLSEGDRATVLDRLIDEELLLQRALALDLPRRDPRLRSEIVSTVIADVVDTAEAREPSDEELRRWLAANASRFSREPHARIEQLFFAVPPSGDVARGEVRARDARARLAAGEPFESLRAQGDRPMVDAPLGLASRASLTEALGPTVARWCMEGSVGAVSEPLRSGAGFHLVRVVERSEGGPPDFEAAREQVRADYLRHRGEERLRAALSELRADGDVRVRGR